jgi:4a-hydroxytetrahydrobiopterin dehydratase
MAATLPDSEIESRVRELPGWRYDDGKLRRQYAFADFPCAFAFMTRCAFAAETLNHHPDWSNVWNKVDVVLWSHDAGGVTDRDFALAKAMDVAAGECAPPKP